METREIDRGESGGREMCIKERRERERQKERERERETKRERIRERGDALSYTPLRAQETALDRVCSSLLEKKTN